MKDVSQELDPDTHKQMEKFRKVSLSQSHGVAKFAVFPHNLAILKMQSGENYRAMGCVYLGYTFLVYCSCQNLYL